ncbi:protocadherin alpha-C2-like isoform X1 [Spea bombifrons]|uniref:protocadherin alpha-C2-like isoform X1 n=1 Tax=Spea bombifrons TaxID=233779 RepID=UPI00234B01BE|nr:protocadherin alpha-C2-like isoform X1 [Spea bombifrons]
MAFTRGCIGQVLPVLLLMSLVAGQLRYSVREELNHGAFVGNVVTDLGLDLKQLPSRGFRITSGNSKQYFDVNLGNGVLFVNRTIDRETLCEPSSPCGINLEVVIGNPVEVHNIEVEIVDINDNAPKFPRNDYYLEISESAVPGARFPIESAQDPDIGSNSIQTYKLTDNDYFALDLKTFSGNSKLIELVLKKVLDREKKSLHQLLLTAIDGGSPAKSGTAQISIRVMDTNDNTPFFDKSTYKASLLENAPSGTLVLRLNASDPDEGSNGEVTYSFSSYTPQKVRQLFAIDPQSGEIRVDGNVDYEKAPAYEIYVQATDKGSVPMTGHCKVLVEIIDANDNAPVIEVTSNYSPVGENAQEGTVVALMSITDQDSGVNKQVSLVIPHDIPFKLNSFKNTYKLVTDGALDREKCPSYNITLTATDSGTPPLSSQEIIYVEISDVNDNPPVFEELSYSVYVMENNAPGVSLFSVKANDPDTNENSFVTYMLLQGDIEGLPVSSYVSIKSDNGTIYAVRSFDYEKLREFHFVVQAQDAGNPPLSSTTTVNIFVLDQNDHAPTILYPPTANGSVSLEMIPRTADTGYLVTKVIAIDADSGQNAWLFYYLSQASDPKLFKVELHTGEIRITRKVADDSITNYNLTVLVTDNGQPRLSSSALISVAVVDRVSKIMPDTRRHVKNTTNYSEITIYLIIALCSISFVFLLTIIVLSILKCYRCSMRGDPCCACCCGVQNQNPADIYKQANNNIDTRLPHGLKVQPHFIEVRGNGSLTKTYCYKACLTAGSGSDTFMFYNTGGPGAAGPHAMIADRHLTGQSVQNLIILKSETTTPVEPKHPHPDWRYSASLRAAMQGAVHVEGAAILRGGPVGLEQQWPTVSSATPEPEGGEVSPPVGAGVNCNSWTFKYGPGNQKQPVPQIPPDFPENFIIPGSPAIISIRQDQPSNQGQKSNFITFGKKEETKKKKKKKKGSKNQEKGNNAVDNNDQ